MVYDLRNMPTESEEKAKVRNLEVLSDTGVSLLRYY